MIKKQIKRVCTKDCRACEMTGGNSPKSAPERFRAIIPHTRALNFDMFGPGGSNQPHAHYRKRWADDETLLAPAASRLQTHLIAAACRQTYLQTVEDTLFTVSPGGTRHHHQSKGGARTGSRGSPAHDAVGEAAASAAAAKILEAMAAAEALAASEAAAKEAEDSASALRMEAEEEEKSRSEFEKAASAAVAEAEKRSREAEAALAAAQVKF